MRLRECMYECVGEVVIKKMKDWKMQRWKGSEGKRQSPTAQPSQHVPITAALKPSPARHCFWPILRAGGGERMRFERGKTRGGGVLRGTWPRGRRKNGRKYSWFIWVKGRWIKAENDRVKRGQWGHKQVRKWEHWSTRGKKKEKAARYSEPLLELINQLHWAKLTSRGPVYQFSSCTNNPQLNTQRHTLNILCALQLLLWKLENHRLFTTCCILHFLLLIKTVNVHA